MKKNIARDSAQTYLSATPSVCHGRLVFRGTRIPVATILDLLASGMPLEEILRGYPSLSRKAVQAAILYARRRIEGEEFIPVKKIR